MRTIQSKIFIVFTTVIIIVIILVTLSAYYNSSLTIKRNAINYIQNSIQHADENLQIMLEEIENISTVVAVNHEIVAAKLVGPNDDPTLESFIEKKEIDNYLASLIAYKPYISRIAVIGVNGKTFYAGGHLISKAIIDKPWVKQVLSDKRRHLVYNENGEGTLTVARSLHINGKPVGVVMIDFNSEITQKIYEIQPLSDSIITLLDRNGVFIYHSDKALIQKDIRDTYLSTFYEEMTRTIDQQTYDFNGTTYLVVSFKSTYTEWVTIGMIPLETLLYDVYVIRNQMVVIAIVILLAVLVISIFVSNQITKNLKRLHNSMKLVSSGILTAKPNIKSKDEVGELSDMFTLMMGNLQNLMEGIRNSERQKREAEYKALQAQISPHFLYNTLNTIKYLARLQHAYNIEEISGSLVDLLRSAVDQRTEMITVEDELNYVKQYMNIQKYRYLEAMSVVYDAEEEILNCIIPRLILQPIVENAIIHGFARINKPGLISVKIFKDDDVIRMEVTDNGIGLTRLEIDKIQQGLDFPKNSTGIGLKNVNERIKLAFGEMFGVTIFSEPELFTTVEIIIPEIRRGQHAT
jgi:two-component system sensor histidine kinase YesM